MFTSKKTMFALLTIPPKVKNREFHSDITGGALPHRQESCPLYVCIQDCGPPPGGADLALKA